METVRCHLGKSERKLHVRTRTEAVLNYVKRELESP